MAIFVGIDPGLGGAIAALDHGGNVLLLEDCPVVKVKTKRVMAPAFARGILAGLGRIDHAVLEAVHAMPGQGVTSMFNFGWGLGVWEGILAGRNVPYQKVSPQRWQRTILGGNRDPGARRLAAIAMFPDVEPQLHRKKDEGRADALLIAQYARQSA